ncbi:MAG TPA: CDP-alcohol phosphatidyltransferase family protein [Gemmatimonadaceae bacterium]|nr:CDP-alcohol phosphatidyltransferase family protein [Gemmatimonadaceae bacterium]
MNLPNALTVGRIVVTPLIAWLPFTGSAAWRFVAFMLFLAAAWTDYYDGMLARTRGMITDLGKLLDPLADKLLLIGTFLPMFYLQAPLDDPLRLALLGKEFEQTFRQHFPFVISMLGVDIRVEFPWWIAVVVLGRELAMTIMRQIAARRGTVIAAISAAKVKTVMQLIWIGAAYMWFFVATVDLVDVRAKSGWGFLSNLCGIAGVVGMSVSVALTLYSMAVYMWRFGPILLGSRTPRPRE